MPYKVLILKLACLYLCAAGHAADTSKVGNTLIITDSIYYDAPECSQRYLDSIEFWKARVKHHIMCQNTRPIKNKPGQVPVAQPHAHCGISENPPPAAQAEPRGAAKAKKHWHWPNINPNCFDGALDLDNIAIKNSKNWGGIYGGLYFANQTRHAQPGSELADTQNIDINPLARLGFNYVYSFYANPRLSFEVSAGWGQKGCTYWRYMEKAFLEDYGKRHIYKRNFKITNHFECLAFGAQAKLTGGGKAIKPYLKAGAACYCLLEHYVSYKSKSYPENTGKTLLATYYDDTPYPVAIGEDDFTRLTFGVTGALGLDLGRQFFAEVGCSKSLNPMLSFGGFSATDYCAAITVGFKAGQ